MNDKLRYLILLLLLLGSAGFLVLSLEPPPKPVKKPINLSATSQKAEVLINKHLWQTNHAREQAQLRVEAQNAYMVPKIGEAVWPEEEKNQNHGVDHSPDRNENNVYNDLNRDRREYRLSNPDHVIQSQIHDNERMRQYEDAYRKEYARQFVENAKRNGYDVKLNADLVVIGVKPISKFPRQPSAYDQKLGTQAR